MASGIIRSYTLPAGHTSGGEGAHWSFEWTSTKKSAGVSTVTWYLYTRGRNSSPKTLNTGCWLDIAKNGVSTRVYAEEHTGDDASFVDVYRDSGTFEVEHNASGYASFTVNFEVYIYDKTRKKTSQLGVLDTLPAHATITSAPNFTDEDYPTIYYSNPAGVAVDSLQACIANSTGSTIYVPYRDIPVSDATYTFNFTEAERDALRSVSANTNSLAVRFYVKTVIDGETYLSSLPKTLSIVNADPIVTATAEDTNSATLALTGDHFKYVRYHSNVQVSMNAKAQKKATIIDTIGEGTYNNVETNSWTLLAIDSRGNSTRTVVTGTLIPYIRLTCNLIGNTPDTNGNMTLECSGNYFNGSFGAVNNTLQVQYRYKTITGSYGNWVDMNVTTNGNTYDATASLTGLSYRETYTFQARAVDKLDTVSTGENHIKSLPIFHWGKEDFVFEVPVSFAAGCVGCAEPEDPDGVDGDFNITGNLRLKGSGNYGNALYFGDGSYCYLKEESDDVLTIKSTGLNLNTSSLNFNQRSIAYGEWTPSLSSSAVSSYNTRRGWYQKLGSVVTIGFTIKANCNSGYDSTSISINGVPFTPSADASGGGMCSGAYVSGGFNFECWAINTSGTITARVQSCNNTSNANISTSASGCFYRSGGGEITIGGTICFLTSD